MPKFAANLSMMFNEVPFLERFGEAACAGFTGVEYLFPYGFPVDAIRAELKKHHLINALFNLPPGNWAGGERGITCIPEREDEFRSGVKTAIDYAKRLGTTQLHAMAGVIPSGVEMEKVHATYIANLKYAANELAGHGITLLIEAINTRDVPGFYLNTQAQAFSVLQKIGAKNLKLQMDFYHMQIMEGDLTNKLKTYLAHCGHVQIASVPRRSEPDAGEVNYSFLFAQLDQIGYDGWVGCEYRPSGNTMQGLAWFKKFREQMAVEK